MDTHEGERASRGRVWKRQRSHVCRHKCMYSSWPHRCRLLCQHQAHARTHAGTFYIQTRCTEEVQLTTSVDLARCLRFYLKKHLALIHPTNQPSPVLRLLGERHQGIRAVSKAQHKTMRAPRRRCHGQLHLSNHAFYIGHRAGVQLTSAIVHHAYRQILHAPPLRLVRRRGSREHPNPDLIGFQVSAASCDVAL